MPCVPAVCPLHRGLQVWPWDPHSVSKAQSFPNQESATYTTPLETTGDEEMTRPPMFMPTHFKLRNFTLLELMVLSSGFTPVRALSKWKVVQSAGSGAPAWAVTGSVRARRDRADTNIAVRFTVLMDDLP